jgi:hypothetical protein
VTVSVELLTPLAVIPLEGEPTKVDVAAEAAPGINVTLAATLDRPDGEATESVFVSALVLESVVDHCPAVFVEPEIDPKVFEVPVPVIVTP